MSSSAQQISPGTSPTADDPFAKLRDPNDDPFARRKDSGDSTGSMSHSDDATSPVTQPMSMAERRMSKEWDAAKTPPSKFQKLPGSIFATPSSRDGHIARNKIHGFKEKVMELSGKKPKDKERRRSSTS